MRSFWFGLFGFLSVVFALNFLVDVSGLRSYEKIYRLSKEQSADKLLVWDKYFDQRPWLKAKLDDNRTRPDVLILGSSTMGTVSNHNQKSLALLNGWLTGGNIEDLEAITEVLELNTRPAVILLGADPWYFNERDTSESWRSLSDDFLAFQRKHGDGGNRLDLQLQTAEYEWQLFKERLNFSSTYQTAVFVWQRLRRHLKWEPELVTMDPDAYCKTVRKAPWIRAGDGHYHICRNLRGITRATVQAAAETYVVKNTHFIRDWEQIDPDRLQRLERVISIWRSWGSKVVIVAPPMHPVAYAKVTGVPEIAALLDEMDAALTRISRTFGAEYVNLRNPGILGCTAEQFRDGHHSDQSCADLILKKSLLAAGIPEP